MYCRKCGKELSDDANFCPNCAEKTAEYSNPIFGKKEDFVDDGRKSKLAAGLLGILLGGLGIHNFYLGYNGKGVAQILLTFLVCGTGYIWGFIEGIMILVGSINRDANGNSLKQDC